MLKGESKMENMPFEVWEHRITEILDKKLEPIIRELHNLAENQRTMARIEAFNIANQPYDNLYIVGQTAFNNSEEGMKVELDYAMAQYTFSDELMLRLGRNKHTFGKYSEISSVGTLRPFFSLPQSVYGSVGLSAKSYDGIGFSGGFYTDNDWSFNYDVYGGEINLLSSHPWHIEADSASAEHEEHGSEEFAEVNHIKDILGARVIISTPVTGLNFSFSAFTGKPEGSHGEEGEEEPEFGDHKSYSGYIEYENYDWSVIGEYGRHNHGDEEHTNAAYFQVAYKLDNHWQIAGQYEWLNTEVEIDEEEGEIPSSVFKHTALGVGLNYWFNNNFVLKTAYHYTSGNRFALPDEFHEAIAEGSLNEVTNYFMLGGQFSF